MRRFAIVGGVVVVVAAAAILIFSGSTYHVKVALPTASNLFAGSRVQISGFEAGSVSSLQAHDGEAVANLSINKSFATPLHQGATVAIQWKALLGERIVMITDGPATNPTIPDGGTITGSMSRNIEVDEVLSTLDKPTLDHLSSLVKNLNTASVTHESDTNATVQAAGPALNALGSVLDALGTDGPAIRDLVTRLNLMLGTLANHQQDVRTVVTQLGALTAQAAQHQQQLREGLHELPPTLRTARVTLDKVPGVTKKVVPLLHDLEPATDKLKPFARDLRPVFEDLRPTVRELRPTLFELSRLLQVTPGLLDSSYRTVPKLTTGLDWLSPVFNTLRAYTPEATGFLANADSGLSNYDSNGHFARFNVQYGVGTVPFSAPNPGVVPPGQKYAGHPMPGEIAGTPWKDAFGEGVR